METPMATCYMIYNGSMEYTLENRIKMDMLSQIMDIVYTEKIREDEGGTYGVGTDGNVMLRPEPSFMFLIGFNTNKEMYEKLMGIAKTEFQNVADNGPRPEDLQKVKEYMVKKHAEDLENNQYWMTCIQTEMRDGINLMDNYEKIVNGITAQDIADITKQVLNGYKKEAVQLPK